MQSTQASSPEWHRLQANAERNRSEFDFAGHPDVPLPLLKCPRCGCWERACFWEAAPGGAATLWLSCPECHGYRVRWDSRRKRVAVPWLESAGPRVALGVGLVLLAGAATVPLFPAAAQAALGLARGGGERVWAGLTGWAYTPTELPAPPADLGAPDWVERGRGGGPVSPAVTAARASSGSGSARSAPAPRRAPRPRPAASRPAPAPPTAAVFVATGDRASEIRRELGAGVTVSYDPQRNETRVSVPSERNGAWRRLQLSRGWERVEAGSQP